MRECATLWPSRGPLLVDDLPHKTMAEIKRDVAAFYGLTLAELEGPSRIRHIAWARQHAFVLAYAQGRFSLPWIGRQFGNRDHTTVLHGIRRCLERAEKGIPVPTPTKPGFKANEHLVALCRALAQQERAA